MTNVLKDVHLVHSLFCDVGPHAGKYRVTLKGIVSHAELSALQTSVAQQVSDKITLDAIATVMSNEEWNGDTADLIAGLVRESGREIKELPEPEDEPDRRDAKVFQDLADSYTAE